MGYRQFPRLYVVGRRLINCEADAVDTDHVPARNHYSIDDRAGFFNIPYLDVDGVRHAVAGDYFFIVVPISYLINIEILGMNVLFSDTMGFQCLYDLIHRFRRLCMGISYCRFLGFYPQSEDSHIRDNGPFTFAVNPDALLLAVKVYL